MAVYGFGTAFADALRPALLEAQRKKDQETAYKTAVEALDGQLGGSADSKPPPDKSLSSIVFDKSVTNRFPDYGRSSLAETIFPQVKFYTPQPTRNPNADIIAAMRKIPGAQGMQMLPFFYGLLQNNERRAR